MWPLPLTAFNKETCPWGSNCEFPYCIFSHDDANVPASNPTVPQNILSSSSEPPAKRLKIDAEAELPATQSDNASSKAHEPPVFTGVRASKPAPTTSKQETTVASSSDQGLANGESSNAIPQSNASSIPPPTKEASAQEQAKPEEEVRLLPRKVQHEPTTFPKRVIRLKMLHELMIPLNKKVVTAVRPATKALHMTANQLKKLAIDEEEKVANENRSLYENVMGHRIAAYRKMSVDDWVKARREAAVAKQNGQSTKGPPPKKVDTGMTLTEEAIVLSSLRASEKDLRDHDYVVRKPSAAEVKECQMSLIASNFWEKCDRCNTRFQAFPDRRQEDGALTTGGKCRYHWGKKSRNRDGMKFTCCNELVDSASPGCTECDTHVFKSTDVKRMAVVMQFVNTPENPKVDPQSAVCFDCEMGYTTCGFELLRLTAIAWPSHRPLIDVLVRPIGFVLDLNTQWSGITMDAFINAKPYDPADSKPRRNDLRMVASPYVARDLFLEHVSPTTPVLGHSLENDLNVLRLIHPTIVDTAILYPAPRGLPWRQGLKSLAQQHLKINIQQGGASGHDSYEDARATGELVRLRVGEHWKWMKERGWMISDGAMQPPLPRGLPPRSAVPTAPSMIITPNVADADPSTTTTSNVANANGNQGVKRKAEQITGSIELPVTKK